MDVGLEVSKWEALPISDARRHYMKKAAEEARKIQAIRLKVQAEMDRETPEESEEGDGNEKDDKEEKDKSWCVTMWIII